MSPIHLAIGVVEGLATAVVCLRRARAAGRRADASRARPRARGLACGRCWPTGGGRVLWAACCRGLPPPIPMDWSGRSRRRRGQRTPSPVAGLHQVLTAVQEKTCIAAGLRFPGTAPPRPGGEPRGRRRAGTSIAGLVGGVVTLALVRAGVLLSGVVARPLGEGARMSRIELACATGSLDGAGCRDTPRASARRAGEGVATSSFIIAVMSFARYTVAALLPFSAYPVALISLGDIPVAWLSRKMLVAAPVAVVIGVFNPLFDREPMSLGRRRPVRRLALVRLDHAAVRPDGGRGAGAGGLHRHAPLCAGLERLGVPRCSRRSCYSCFATVRARCRGGADDARGNCGPAADALRCGVRTAGRPPAPAVLGPRRSASIARWRRAGSTARSAALRRCDGPRGTPPFVVGWVAFFARGALVDLPECGSVAAAGERRREPPLVEARDLATPTPTAPRRCRRDLPLRSRRVGRHGRRQRGGQVDAAAAPQRPAPAHTGEVRIGDVPVTREPRAGPPRRRPGVPGSRRPAVHADRAGGRGVRPAEHGAAAG